MRFALGEPQIDTTSVDSAANALETKAFFIRKIGSDGFQIRHQPTLRKVVSDRRASLDEETEVKPTKRFLIRKEFERGATIPIVPFPDDSASIQDSPRLTLVLIEPGSEWNGSGNLRQQIAEWTKQRGASPRLYPGSLVWCVKKPGRDLRDKIELWLAWKRVKFSIRASRKRSGETVLHGVLDSRDRSGRIRSCGCPHERTAQASAEIVTVGAEEMIQ